MTDGSAHNALRKQRTHHDGHPTLLCPCHAHTPPHGMLAAHTAATNIAGRLQHTGDACCCDTHLATVLLGQTPVAGRLAAGDTHASDTHKHTQRNAMYTLLQLAWDDCTRTVLSTPSKGQQPSTLLPSPPQPQHHHASAGCLGRFACGDCGEPPPAAAVGSGPSLAALLRLLGVSSP